MGHVRVDPGHVDMLMLIVSNRVVFGLTRFFAGRIRVEKYNPFIKRVVFGLGDF